MIWIDATANLHHPVVGNPFPGHVSLSQVSVVAGLEALKDAGIVTGVGDGGWLLPEHMRDTTGVMYASSFPALDAAIGEVKQLLWCCCFFFRVLHAIGEAFADRA